MKKNKICIFTGFALPHLGGVERYTDKLVEQLKVMGYEITIVSTNYDNISFYDKLDNYEIYRLPTYNLCKNRYPLLKKNKEYRAIINKINTTDFDSYICQTRFYLTSQIGAKMAYMHNKKPIIIEHGSSHFTVNNKILDFFGAIYEHLLTNRLKKYEPKFYGVSNRCTKWLKHFKIEASGVLYNSIDPSVYDKYKNEKYSEDVKEDKIIISYIGRIIKEKGVGLLLDVFTKISPNYPNIELYIAGDGPCLNEYKENYKNSRIHFEGKINYEQVLKLCNQTDIFVHPSMYPEGLPTSILEAGIMKSAVIATDRGGTVEVINNKKYGLIMAENEKSLEENLKSLLDHPKMIEELKNNLQKRILEEFTWQVTAKKLIKEMEKNK